MRLAGTYHPLAYLLERVWEIFPGIADVSGCWRDYNQQLCYQLSDTLLSLSPEEEVQIQKLRNTKATHNWLAAVNLFQQPNFKTLTLDHEQNHRALAIYFESPVDNQMDILVIDFSEKIVLKNDDLDFKSLSTTEKFLLSTFLTQQLQAEYKRVIQERSLLTHFSQTATSQQANLVLLQDKLNETEVKYKHAITNLIASVTTELSQQYDKIISLQEGVIERLASESLTFEQIKSMLSAAASTAYHLNLFSKEISIAPALLHFPSEEKGTTKTRSARKDKVFYMLDRYEDGAVKAKEKGLLVNGKNVAANLEEPISPPAITDAIKKNQKRIRFLLNEYPNHWPNIRKGLRPLILMDEEGISKKRFAS